MPVLMGGIWGLIAAILMYWWQGVAHLSISTFVVISWTGGFWLYMKSSNRLAQEFYDYLRSLPINRPRLRIRRLVRDGAVHWSTLIGLGLMGFSCWYAGLREPISIAGVEVGWIVMALTLNFQLTLMEPTTRCRLCGYQLIGQLSADETSESVRCPECGTQWAKQDLCLAPPETTSSDQSRDAA